MCATPEIIKLFTEGNHEAFRKLFHSFYPKVYAFVRGLVKDKDDTDEVTQLVFIKLWDKRERFREVCHFDSYLFMLTKNTVFNYMAAERATVSIWEDYVPEECDRCTPHEELVARDLQLLIDMVVDGLPPQRKAVYRLNKISGLSNDEIAKRLGIQKKTVENHLNLALKEIRKAVSLYLLCFLMIRPWV